VNCKAKGRLSNLPNLLNCKTKGCPFAVTTVCSSGLKSRPGNCPYAPVAQGSGVLATGGREFPIGKAAGRNASEPVRSLVNTVEDADPVDVWGRPLFADLGNGSGLRNLSG